MKYILEPMVLALDRNVSEKDFKRYVNRLLLWDEWMERYPEDVYLLSDTCELLAMEDFFPVYNVFSELVKKYKVDYVQAADLNRIINKLVGHAQKLDNEVVKAVEEDVVLGTPKTDFKPKDDTCPEGMWKAFGRVLNDVYCHCRKSGWKEDSIVLFCKNISRELTFDVVYETMDEGKDEWIKHTHHARVMCCSSLKEFFCHGGTPVKILENHRNKEDISLAVRVAVYQKGSLKRVMDAFSGYQFYIQHSFYKDYTQANYRTQPSFLTSFTNAMSNCLLNRQMRDREDFRTGKGGNNPQMRHGDYGAWRWYVTQSVKMQYWQRGDDYRFANIKEHDIYECVWEDKVS